MENMEHLTEVEAAILNVLNDHHGKGNAIPRVDLVEHVNHSFTNRPIPERTIRQTIKHMVEKHNHWIGSGHNGYFMVETDQELIDVCRYYHNYGLSLLHVEARLKNISMAELMGQMRLEIG
jgi:hypothetical protein